MRKLSHAEIIAERLSHSDALAIVRHPVNVMISNVRSLYNVGSIFRTCDSGLAGELILTGFTPYPPRIEIEKTALGAVNTVPWEYFKSIESAIGYQRSKGVKIIALEITDNKRTYDSLIASDYPLCIIAGNELTGLDDNVIDLCDDSIEIPMYGVKHSLNVSVAVGIALFEAVRIWKSLSDITLTT